MFTPLRFAFACLFSLAVAQAAIAADCAPDARRGAQVFTTECGVCHAVKKDVAGLMGPNLNGVIGRKSGSLAGFSYSPAMRNKDVTWQAETIAELITQPQAYVPGTYMPYMGLASADDRQAVVCFLKSKEAL
ncbi:c-type cytochrome [Pseudomonas sp. FP2196]|uniref:c-type cytochrome n=1 Tax=Pseudomonas sp. FP2196 TaxID=2954086 RepID=UPI0027351A65|nr:c-type cytochrome [Pseudomonas sp. FP2196]WLH37947.1 c-type cytochrome [Pseudomonas sp. FP2196]